MSTIPFKKIKNFGTSINIIRLAGPKSRTPSTPTAEIDRNDSPLNKASAQQVSNKSSGHRTANVLEIFDEIEYYLCIKGVKHIKIVDYLSFGKGKNSDIQIRTNDSDLRHCRFYQNSNLLNIMDLGSKNGIYVNGKKLLPGQLKVLVYEDLIRIDRYIVKVTATPPLMLDEIKVVDNSYKHESNIKKKEATPKIKANNQKKIIADSWFKRFKRQIFLFFQAKKLDLNDSIKSIFFIDLQEIGMVFPSWKRRSLGLLLDLALSLLLALVLSNNSLYQYINHLTFKLFNKFYYLILGTTPLFYFIKILLLKIQNFPLSIFFILGIISNLVFGVGLFAFILNIRSTKDGILGRIVGLIRFSIGVIISPFFIVDLLPTFFKLPTLKEMFTRSCLVVIEPEKLACDSSNQAEKEKLPTKEEASEDVDENEGDLSTDENGHQAKENALNDKNKQPPSFIQRCKNWLNKLYSKITNYLVFMPKAFIKNLLPLWRKMLLLPTLSRHPGHTYPSPSRRFMALAIDFTLIIMLDLVVKGNAQVNAIYSSLNNSILKITLTFYQMTITNTFGTLNHLLSQLFPSPLYFDTQFVLRLVNDSLSRCPLTIALVVLLLPSLIVKVSLGQFLLKIRVKSTTRVFSRISSLIRAVIGFFTLPLFFIFDFPALYNIPTCKELVSRSCLIVKRKGNSEEDASLDPTSNDDLDLEEDDFQNENDDQNDDQNRKNSPDNSRPPRGVKGKDDDINQSSATSTELPEEECGVKADELILPTKSSFAEDQISISYLWKLFKYYLKIVAMFFFRPLILLLKKFPKIERLLFQIYTFITEALLLPKKSHYQVAPIPKRLLAVGADLVLIRLVHLQLSKINGYYQINQLITKYLADFYSFTFEKTLSMLLTTQLAENSRNTPIKINININFNFLSITYNQLDTIWHQYISFLFTNIPAVAAILVLVLPCCFMKVTFSQAILLIKCRTTSRTEGWFKSRIKSFSRSLLGVLLTPFLLFDLTLIFNLPTVKEIISRSPLVSKRR